MGCLFALAGFFILVGGVGSIVNFGLHYPISEFWGYFLLLCSGVLGIIILFIIQVRLQSKAQIKAEIAKKQAAIKAHLKLNREKQHRMVILGEESISIFESLPVKLKSVEKNDDQAEIDYADNAFAPFWDSIEKAVKALCLFDNNIESLKHISSEYTELTKEYEGNPPQFPLSHKSVAKLGVGAETAKRMQSIVSKAQRNFQFAMIYEQRKTNQILVAGFTSLAEALSTMTRSLTQSIKRLETSIDKMSSTLNESLQSIQSQIDDNSEITEDYLNSQAEREKRTLDILDNIQRGRKPIL